MTARFAGSSTLDARRRRRLATEPDHAEPPTDLILHEPDVADERGDDGDEARAGDEPVSATVDTWLPRTAWKTWLLFLLVAMVAGGTVAVGRAVDHDRGFYGPELSTLLGLQDGRLPRAVGSLLLFLSGQLALTVWWARSRSTRDYSGRYDVWLWAAGAWFVFALAHETRAHLAWNEVAKLVWEPDFWNRTILSWFAPAVAAGGVLWLAARADARRCRSARLLLTLAAASWVSAGLFALGLGSRWYGPWQDLLVVSTAMAGHALGFGAMLLHARFVTHVCNDPPEAARPLSRREFVDVEDRAAKEADLTNGPADEANAIEETDVPAPVERTSRRSRTKSKPVEPEPVIEKESAPTAVETKKLVVEEPPTEVSAEQNDDESEADRSSESDGPPPEMLRGLSKRQKKRVRREWRERQREGLADAA